MQTVVTVSCTVCAHVRFPKILGTLEPPPLWMGAWLPLTNTPLSTIGADFWYKVPGQNQMDCKSRPIEKNIVCAYRLHCGSKKCTKFGGL